MIRCSFGISWQLDGVVEFAAFSASSVEELSRCLDDCWERAVAEGADLEGEDEPVLTLRATRGSGAEETKEVSFSIARSSAAFLARTDEVVDFEPDWEDIGISTSELPEDSDPTKMAYIVDKLIAWSAQGVRLR